MRRFTMIMVVLAGFASRALALSPNIMNYQGRLTDGTGNPVADGTHSVVFAIYTDVSGGIPLWTETQSIFTSAGLFEVPLGARTPFTPALFSDSSRYLGIKVDSDPELFPRVRMTSFAYAFSAVNADYLGGIAASGFASAVHTHALSALSDVSIPTPVDGQVLTYKNSSGKWEAQTPAVGTNSGWVDDGTTVRLQTATDFVGIGTSSPTRPLHISDPSNGLFVSRMESGNTSATVSELSNSSSASTWEQAVAGSAGAFGGAVAAGSLYLYHQGNSTGPDMVIGPDDRIAMGTPSPSGVGITLTVASSHASTARAIDALAKGNGTNVSVSGSAVMGLSGDATGIYGVVSGSHTGTTAYALRGQAANLATGSTSYGAWASATGGGTNYGIYAEAYNGTTNYAGVFLGNVDVNGTLSKSAGSFKIDHPLDPENKYLQHSFVESPDMMNIYNGNVVTSTDGYAVVTLPDWFGALNKDFRYQLTVIGDFAQAVVAKEIEDNQFTIRTDKPLVKVSWQVTGIRHDPYADANRIQVEVPKEPEARGLYLHPEVYGLAKSRGIGFQLSEKESAMTPRLARSDRESTLPAK